MTQTHQTANARGRDPRIVIVGAGMAGIAVAHAFRRAGFTNFTILEKGSDVGAVWHWNRYPGLRCDVPSHGYQFAFAPKPDWKHVWATGEEIQRCRFWTGRWNGRSSSVRTSWLTWPPDRPGDDGWPSAMRGCACEPWCRTRIFAQG
jgi:cation diffusion facilitator CzcD-associated flavoprotein CzcO